MNGGSVNVYSDSLGKQTITSCLRIPLRLRFLTPEAEFSFIDIRNVELKDISIIYNDQS